MSRFRTTFAGALILAAAAALVAPASSSAQPVDDRLPPGLFADHREAFMARMDGGLAIFPTTPEIPRNDDADHPWRQDSDLWWLTGFDEPGAYAVLRPGAPAGERYALFVRPKNPEEEVWTGYRAGVEGARERYAADLAFPVDSLEPVLARWIDEVETVWYDASEDHPWANPAVDSLLGEWSETEGHEVRDADGITNRLRLVKDEGELALLEKAIDITVDAQRAAMAAIRPGMGEWEVEALIEFVYRAHGAARVGFNSIVGSGPNTTILHYVSNDRRMEAGDMVLMDIGAEWHHYTADVTRTVPVSGTFTPEQAAVYRIVLDAQKAVIDIVEPGITIADVQRKGFEVVTEGLIREGFLEGTVEENLANRGYRPFLMHGVSHWLGLDVHDVGGYVSEGRPRTLEPGMVFTVEPGVYIAEGMEGVDPKWWNIGVRIEDDILVTEDGHENLSAGAPREIEAIEALMAGRGLPEVVPAK
ncbi:MAG: aminopeptidase P N-terminal domain-containing protein [Gemmatimonadota bacterium]|nr:aminopeptidase P N-terminal domain-containing protein [Gemmatimonadota bacterium]